MRKESLLSIYREGNQVSERLNDHPKVTVILDGRARIKPKVLDTKSRALPMGAPAPKKLVISSMAGYHNQGKCTHCHLKVFKL